MIQFSDYKEAMNSNKTILIRRYSASHNAYELHDRRALKIMEEVDVEYTDDPAIDEFKIINKNEK